MIDLAAPGNLWALAAAPLVGLLAGLAWRQRARATAAWAARGLWNRLLPGWSPRRIVVAVVTLVLVVALLPVALARPRWGESEQQVEREGLDVVFVLDTSLSMATRDVVPSRLFVAQSVVRRLVEAMPENRVALVQAEGDGVVMVPLTGDVAVLDLLLDAVEPGTLPTPGTELGSALRRARSLFPEGGAQHRVLVLLSDGEDHGSDLGDLIDELREDGTMVVALGVGSPEGKPLELPASHTDAGAGAVVYKRDENDQVVVSRLIEENLEHLARETGGIYRRVTSAGTDLAAIVDHMQGLETRSYGSEIVNTREERFQWPLGAAIVLLALHLAIGRFEPEARR